MWKYVDTGDGEKIFHKVDEFIFSKNIKLKLVTGLCVLIGGKVL